MKRLSCVNEYAEAMKTNNWTFMTKVMWNESEKKFETEDGFIENLGDTEEDKQAHVFNYILAKLARYFGTYKWLIDVISNTDDWLVIEINGRVVPGGFTNEKSGYELSFQKSELPKLLNETIYPA
jgi:hypothetical protein